jgi:hypothetical protein
MHKCETFRFTRFFCFLYDRPDKTRQDNTTPHTPPNHYMENGDGFAPILAMFYSVFHPTEGTKVIHQVPSGVVVPPYSDDNKINNNLPDSSAFEEPLFDFDVIKNYVIPKPSLCNKLVTLKVDKYRVLGFPVNIYGSHYARNSFGFNFCCVFSYESDTTPYEGNIKRIGRMFRALEEQSQLLSKSLKDSHVYYQKKSEKMETSTLIPPSPSPLLTPTASAPQSSAASIINSEYDSKTAPVSGNFTSKYLRIVDDWDDASRQIVLQKKAPGLDTNYQPKISSIESLIQQIFQDLNNYSECMIPIDASNSVDLKLFPISPPPAHVNPYDVPIALIKLNSLIDPLWDPTMLRIIPFINGINSIAQISELSKANLELTKECIRHLLHYQAVSILDIFQFSNRYFVTSSIGNFLRDPDMARACQEYVISTKGSFANIPLRPILNSDSSRDGTGSGISISSSKRDDFGMRIRRDSTDSTPSFASPMRKDTTMVSNSRGRPEYHMMSSESSIGNHQYGGKYQTYGTRHGNSHAYGHIYDSGVGSEGNSKSMKIKRIMLPSIATLFQLYNSLGTSSSVSHWVIENEKLLEHIDIRKFVTFGVRNGIVARTHVYPVIRKTGRGGDDFEGDITGGMGMGLEVEMRKMGKGRVIIEGGKGNGVAGSKSHQMQILNASAAPMMSNSRAVEKSRSDKDLQRKESTINGSEEEEEDDEEEESSDSDDAGVDDEGEKDQEGIKDKENGEEAADEFVDATEKRRQRRAKKQEQLLRRLMRHTMHMDAICTAMSLSRKDVLAMLAKMGDVEMIEV